MYIEYYYFGGIITFSLGEKWRDNFTPDKVLSSL